METKIDKSMTLAEFEATYGVGLIPDSFAEKFGVTTAGELAGLMRGHMDPEQETVVLVTLNTKLQAISIVPVFKGTLDQSLVHPRDIFRIALRDNAFAIALSHNHPSGSSTPSSADIAVKRRLQEGCDIFGIKMIDFLICTHMGWASAM